MYLLWRQGRDTLGGFSQLHRGKGDTDEWTDGRWEEREERASGYSSVWPSASKWWFNIGSLSCLNLPLWQHLGLPRGGVIASRHGGEGHMTWDHLEYDTRNSFTTCCKLRECWHDFFFLVGGAAVLFRFQMGSTLQRTIASMNSDHYSYELFFPCGKVYLRNTWPK